MKIEILDAAEKDLIDGFKFYDRQSKGLGDYFRDTIFSDIESLHIYAVFMHSISDITAYYPKDFHSLSITGLKITLSKSMPY